MTDTTNLPATADPADATAGTAPRRALTALRLPELQRVATELGISGTTRMRKQELLDAIRAKRSGGPSDGPSGPNSAGAPVASTTSAAGARPHRSRP